MLRSRVAAARAQAAQAEAARDVVIAPAAAEQELRSSPSRCGKRERADLSPGAEDESDTHQEERAASRKFLMRKLSDSQAQPLPGCKQLGPEIGQTSPYPSVAWWTRPMKDAVAAIWEARMNLGLLRPVRLEEGCAGFGTCGLALQSLGVPLQSGGVACDIKPYARGVLCTHMGAEAHVFGTLADHARGHGWCFAHSRQCTLDMEARVDILCAGPPCQPFTGQRSDHHITGYENHVGVQATLGEGSDSVHDLIARRRPGIGIIENVLSFAKADPRTGLIPLVVFCDAVRKIKDADGDVFYPATHVIELSPRPWITMDRPRTVACVMHAFCGLD